MAVGKSVIRLDSKEKVTGRALYVEDIYMTGMLYAKVFRSPVAHGIIKNLDISEALKIKGVKGIFTAKDIPGKNIIHVILDDQPFLAKEKVMYPGHPIAVVAAITPEACEKALKTIKVEIEELPAIIDFEQSKNNSVKLFENNNVFCSFKIRKGDFDKKYDSNDYVTVEETFYTQHQEHAYIEPQGAIVYWEDDTLTIRGSMQAPFYVQRAVSEVLNLQYSRVRVIQQTTGGAFGGKEDVPSLVCAQAAICAYHLRVPVRIVYDREEDMQTMSKRHPSRVKIKLTADKTGKFVHVYGDYLENAGAYSTLTPAVLYRGTVHLPGPYKIDNIYVDAEAVATNTVPNGAYRGFGSPQVIFAMESAVDMLAEKLGMDPVEIRGKNLVDYGDTNSTGQILNDSVGMKEVYNKVVEKADYFNWKKQIEEFNSKSEYIKKGLGVSTLYYGVGLGAAGKSMSRCASMVKIDADGSVTASVGVTEMGQGLRTVTAQMVAEFLGIDIDKVVVSQIDTSRISDTGPTVASRGTITAGWGVLSALAKIKKSLHKFLEKKYNTSFEDVYFKDGKVKFGNNELEYSELIKMATDEKIHLHETGLHVPPDTTFDKETGLGDAYYAYAWAMNILETEVNKLTGEVTLKKAVCGHDVGKAINPREVAGQIMGGSLQGLGYGLMEDMQVSSKGKIITSNFSTYTIPTSCDIPEFIPVIVESNYSKGPYGAKGFGEQPLMGMAPALTNSIYNAVGARVKQIPATPERVQESMKNIDF
ncbi:MAG: xanthine dehydrogenase family protein molybdopterin-binding subunit [Candidatus Muiribacteriota bacterium]